LFALTAIAPTLIAILYFGIFASDVYISESRFVVRAPSQTAASPLSAVLGQAGLGGAGGVEGNDSVVQYVLSRRALEDANQDDLVREAFTDPATFFLDRFGSLGGSSQEELYEYFGGKVAITQAASSQVITLRVSAFDPAKAQEINSRLLLQSEELVNSLSERAEEDSLSLAEDHVDRATKRAQEARLQLANFQQSKGIVDPEQQSLVGLQMIGKLQDELIAAQTQMRQLQTYTPAASQIPFLKTQISALKQEIERGRQALSGGSGSISSAMVRYQELRVNSEFAEQQLAIALASLQEAQAEARRKRAYVERVSDPSLPDFAERPRRIRSILATLVLGLVAWGVLAMLLVGVREHRD
jgi:ABC-2 type transport system permease protein/capsular polysaccharide transport system permease protein